MWHPRANRNRPMAVRSAVAPGTASTGHLSHDVHGTSRRFCASANQSAALVPPDCDTLRTDSWLCPGRPKLEVDLPIYITVQKSQPIRTRPLYDRPWHLTDRSLVVPGPSETGYWPRWFAVSANQSASRYCSEPEVDLPEDIKGLRSCWVLQSVFLNNTSGCASFWRCE